MKSHEQLAPSTLKRIARDFDRQTTRVYGRPGLMRLFTQRRDDWGIRISNTRLLEVLLAEGPLQDVVLTAEANYPQIRRYVWRDATDFEIAASLRKNCYLSHSTAVFLHGLTDYRPQTYYVNAEQSPKPHPEGRISQAALDRAFRASQRLSKLAYIRGRTRMVITSGKHTGRFGVIPLTIAEGRTVDVTDIERTLVDLAVRPAYGGGVHQVLNVFRAALHRASIPTLIRTLDALDYAYPYHQAIGFYLERAGAPESDLKPLRKRPMTLKFYLAHGLKSPAYDSSWRVFFPKRL